VLTETIADQRAWRASTIDSPESWYYPLPGRCLAALDRAIRELPRQPPPTTAVVASDSLHAECAADLQPVLRALERGRGFIILKGVPVERYTAEELQLCYWLLGQFLGHPTEQNVQGTLLYDVRDTGQDVRYGARFSVTNVESTFHTDNSFGVEGLDYVGLLCVKTAKAGGLSQVVSAYAVHDELRAKHPHALATLYKPFHVDRRGGLRPGDPPTVRFPIMHWDGQDLTCRYLRYWIEVGHEKAAEPLTPVQVHALDVLDRVLGDADLRVEFNLKPGDMFFLNNRWILHNRTGFEDHPEPELRRHYVRLWLRRKG
jgi:alpha-ketoglutarate-dependent taurine dioxygenase